MGFLDSLKSVLAGGGTPNTAEHWIYVRCRRCGEIIKTRIDLQYDLSMRDEGGYVTHKTLVGNRLCFERIEVTLYFDQSRNLMDREIAGGEFVSPDDVELGGD